MPNRTSEVRSADAGRAWTAGLALTCLALSTIACDEDIGRCCRTLDPAVSARVPTATTTMMGRPTSDIALDPQFDCASLTCVAYQGSQAYCTARCFDDEDCPEDFACRTVLESDPGPGAEIRPTDRFCVRDAHQCTD